MVEHGSLIGPSHPAEFRVQEAADPAEKVVPGARVSCERSLEKRPQAMWIAARHDGLPDWLIKECAAGYVVTRK
jgi:hypothetical protein